ncbi:MAG TPA: diiron oxygenase [Planctomycetota bacterium]|nr:diiron oxygenase [Planctomycetota bacterium]
MRTTLPDRTADRSARSVFADCLAASARVRWKVEDLIGDDKALDFSKHFLPEEFARTRRLPFLTDAERRALSQIRGYVYLKMFVNIEAFVMPFVVEQAMAEPTADDVRTRALLEFAAEEAKHTQMLNRFAEAFEAGFRAPVQVIGPPEAIAAEMAGREPLAVGLTVLGGEWVSLEHYVGSVRDDAGLCPVFKGMLKHHWLEESQHARMDTVLVEEHAATLSPEAVARGVDGYFAIGDWFDAGLREQVGFDLESFQAATGRVLDAGEREAFLREQLQALRWTFLGSALAQARFQGSLERLVPGSAARAREVAAAMS